MAAKRTTGAAQRGGRSGASAQKGRGKASATRVPTPLRGSARGDIVGLFIAVLAIAMMVAVVSPSSAPVTYATHYVLQLVFGAGALLFPLSLLHSSSCSPLTCGAIASSLIRQQDSQKFGSDFSAS